jgi:hypothetical protein
MEEKHSRLGIASFALSLVVGFLILVLFVVAGVLAQRHGTGSEQYPGSVAVGAGMILLVGLDFLAIGLGIAAVCQKERKRLFGVLGLVFAALTVFGAGALIAVGVLFTAMGVK